MSEVRVLGKRASRTQWTSPNHYFSNATPLSPTQTLVKIRRDKDGQLHINKGNNPIRRNFFFFFGSGYQTQGLALAK
jgi:hypothetical protein